MENKYVVPAQTRIGHVHLKVADIKRSLAFYCDLLGFEVSTLYGDQAAFISAGGYHWCASPASHWPEHLA